MARSDKDAALKLADKWLNEAFSLEQQARSGGCSPMEKKLLDMHARVKHGAAQELKIEMQKVRRDG
jgi:hypothetical protein